MTYRFLRLSTDQSQFQKEGLSAGSFDHLADFAVRAGIFDAVIRNEHLEVDLVEVLRRLDHETDAAELRGWARTNTSAHRDAASYYDAETAALVASQERLLVEKYGDASPV